MTTIVDIETGEILEALTIAERQELAECEAKIERGLQTFYEVGEALLNIRDKTLYRETHSSFEAYCFDRWQIKKAHVYRLMDAAQTVNNLKTSPTGDLPSSEYQARPLTQLEPEAQRLAWEVVQQTAPAGKVTAAHVKSVVEVLKEVTRTGAIDDGSGEQIAVADVFKAVVTEETYERMKRQETHLRSPQLYTSDSPEWYTPPDILRRAVLVMGAIDLDPCSNSHLNPNVPAKLHFTAEDNGLTHEWYGRVYMNPPYGRELADWIAKIVEEYRAGNVSEALVLVPSRTDTEWFRMLREFPRCFLFGRLKFNAHDNPAPFPSMVVNLGCDKSRFSEAFSEIGDVYELVK